MALSSPHRAITVAALLIFGATAAQAQLVGHDCLPRWGMPFLKEKVNPESFWNSVLTELKQKTNAAHIRHQMFLIEQQQGEANLRFDEAKSRVLGIPQYTTPELEKQMADGQRFIEDMNAKLTRSTLEMTERCAAHAEAQLAHLRHRTHR